MKFCPTATIQRLLWAGLPCLLIACSSGEPEQHSPPPPKSIKYYTIGEHFGGSVRRITGLVEPADQTQLSFRVGGKVAKVLVKQGDLVSKDQLLAELDAKDYRTALSSAQAQLNQARANQQNADTELNRNRQLQQKQLVSAAILDKLQTAADNADSQVKLALDQVEDANRKLRRTKLRSPFSGAISERKLEPFQSVKAGVGVFELQGDTGFKIKVPVAESMMPFIEFGQQVEVDFPGIEALTLPGHISSIGARIEAGSSFPVKVQLSGDTQSVRAGMTANVTFLLGQGKQRQASYMIPLTALSGGDADDIKARRAAVLVYSPETQRLSRRELKLGELRDNNVEVIEGLQAGEIIAAAGLPFLHHGQAVTLWQPQWQKDQAEL
ncbi:MAG: efflux RND transporter periplasmic adaptor subunit [Cellvibrionaceae bacterium]|nr:efflux RND transporter periplasmic adaptor subunit [Cellvibrionaceae bacterium]